MLQGKKRSESNSERGSFGDHGGAEGSDWVRFCRLRRQVFRALVWRSWRWNFEIWINRKIGSNS